MKSIFNNDIFNIFNVEGLDNRMDLIRSDIQPLFRLYSRFISEYIQDKLELTEPLPVHVAKHIQRSVHEPEATWCAIGGDKRGYKKYPHFQIGINGEYLFVTLSFIDNIQYQVEIAKLFQGELEQLSKLPKDIMVIPDHTKLDYCNLHEVDLEKLFKRLETVKSAEFMIGRVEPKLNHQLITEEAYKEWMRQTIDELLPYYQKTMELY